MLTPSLILFHETCDLSPWKTLKPSMSIISSAIFSWNQFFLYTNRTTDCVRSRVEDGEVVELVSLTGERAQVCHSHRGRVGWNCRREGETLLQVSSFFPLFFREAHFLPQQWYFDDIPLSSQTLLDKIFISLLGRHNLLEAMAGSSCSVPSVRDTAKGGPQPLVCPRSQHLRKVGLKGSAVNID